jgi:hypothetical protein
MESDEDDQLERAGLNKRPRNATEAVVQELLKGEVAAKKAKKGGPAASVAGKRKDGKTLAEIEADEGGPIKESLAGMAATKRALNRKAGGKQADDTEIPADVEKFEEQAEVGVGVGVGVGVWVWKSKAVLADAVRFPMFLTSSVPHVQRVQVQEEEGVKFTGFNLEEERETGCVCVQRRVKLYR